MVLHNMDLVGGPSCDNCYHSLRRWSFFHNELKFCFFLFVVLQVTRTWQLNE